MTKTPAKPNVKKLSIISEPLSAASEGRPLCALCTLHNSCVTPYMRPFVPKGWREGRRYLFVGEAPGQDEDGRTKRPFTGEAGQLLHRLWRDAGIEDQEVALVNAVRCRPKNNVDPTMQQIRCCRSFVLQTISALRPTVVLAVGLIALKSLLNIGSKVSLIGARGRRLEIPGLIMRTEVGPLAPTPEVWATYHPSAILHGYIQYRESILDDMKRIQGLDMGRVEYPPEGIPFGPSIAMDTEYAPDGELLTLGLGRLESARAIELDSRVPTWQLTKRKLDWVCARLSLRGAEYLIGHALEGDLDYLVKLGLAKPEWISGEKTIDSFLLARLYDENRGKGAYKLETLALSFFDLDPWKDDTEETIKRTQDAREWTPEQRTERCRLDAWASFLLARHLTHSKEIPAKVARLTHRIAMTLHRIELAGMAINLEDFHARGREWTAASDRAKDEIIKAAFKLGMDEFSPTNKDHVRELVYDKLGHPVKFKTEKEKKPAVNKLALALYKDDPVVASLLEFSSVDKLRSMWYGSDEEVSGARKTPLKQLLNPHPENPEIALLHNRINPIGARTGRRSGSDESDPDSRNSQNWPGPAKSTVCSRWPKGRIASIDYSKLEVVILAWRARDAKLFEYFSGGPGYVGVAKEMLGKVIEEDTPEYRLMKAVVLGTNYHMKAYQLAKDLWDKLGIKLHPEWKEHKRRAHALRERYLDRFPGVRRYIEERIQEVEDTQRVIDPMGHVRHLPHYGPEETEGYWKVENRAVNFPIQSFAAKVTGAAMIDAEANIIAEHKLSLLEWHEILLEDSLALPCSVTINEVHDELVYDLHPDTGKRDLEIVVESMRAVETLRALVPEFRIPLNVDVKVGDRWGAKE